MKLSSPKVMVTIVVKSLHPLTMELNVMVIVVFYYFFEQLFFQGGMIKNDFGFPLIYAGLKVHKQTENYTCTLTNT